MMGRAVDRLVRGRPRRSRRPQLRLPGGEGHPPGRWRGGAGQAGAASRDRARGRRRRCAVRHPGHGEVPDGPARQPAHPPARRQDLRGRRRRRDRPARPHGPAALRRRRPLGGDRRAQGPRHDDPGARQRRRLGGRRRGGDDAGDRLRRRGRRPRLPRAAVAVRRLVEVLAGRPAPPSRPLGFVVVRDGRPRPRSRRAPRPRIAARCGSSASTRRGTSPGIPSAASCADGSRRCRRWPSSTTCSPRSTRRRRSSRAANGSAAATPTGRSGSPCPRLPRRLESPRVATSACPTRPT